MWICSKCGEEIEDQFDSCWKCAAQAEPATPASGRSRRWKLALGLGVLCEALLVLLPALLPNDSWLFAKTFNFLVLSHYVLLRCLEAFDTDSALVAILAAIMVGLVMALAWALLFYCCLEVAARAQVWFRISKRQKLTLGYALGVLGVTISAVAIIDVSRNAPVAFTASEELRSVIDGNTAFALDLYQGLKGQPGNLFFSPYSISTSLAMTYAGARGQTEVEMRRTAHFNLPRDSVHAAFGELIRRMNKVRRWNRIVLAAANSIWCQRDYQFTEQFLNVSHTRYQADAQLADFKRSPDAACDRINAWARQKTKGRVKKMIQASPLTRDTRLILCNAIYFKGRWAVEFKPKDTRPEPFSVATNHTVIVPMMLQTSEFKTAPVQEPSMELLELPYYGKDLSMIVLLPKAVDGLPGVEKELNAESLRSWLTDLDQAHPQKTCVRLPRFTTSQGFELAKLLQSLGMPSAFNDTADFSGMDGTTNLFISDVMHKAFVDVNEAGTEAAAMTLFEVRSKGMTHLFNGNHPFIFLIRENGSGSILFLGRILDPTR